MSVLLVAAAAVLFSVWLALLNEVGTFLCLMICIECSPNAPNVTLKSISFQSLYFFSSISEFQAVEVKKPKIRTCLIKLSMIC
jgi:hypothetical protein